MITLKPVPEFHSAYVLDTTAYTLRFYVKNVDGGLKVSVTAQKSTDGSKASTVEFQNTFAPVMMDPPVSKKVVNEDGTIGNIEILESVDQYCDAEIIRIVKLLPNFTPGQQDGRPVKVWYTIPVNFNIEAMPQ